VAAAPRRRCPLRRAPEWKTRTNRASSGGEEGSKPSCKTEAPRAKSVVASAIASSCGPSGGEAAQAATAVANAATAATTATRRREITPAELDPISLGL